MLKYYKKSVKGDGVFHSHGVSKLPPRVKTVFNLSLKKCTEKKDTSSYVHRPLCYDPLFKGTKFGVPPSPIIIGLKSNVVKDNDVVKNVVTKNKLCSNFSSIYYKNDEEYRDIRVKAALDGNFHEVLKEMAGVLKRREECVGDFNINQLSAYISYHEITPEDTVRSELEYRVIILRRLVEEYNDFDTLIQRMWERSIYHKYDIYLLPILMTNKQKAEMAIWSVTATTPKTLVLSVNP